MQLKENIIEFVENQVISTLKDKDLVNLFKEIAEVFEKIGEKSLIMSPTEFVEYINITQKKESEQALFETILDFSKSYKYPKSAYKLESWYTFLGNKLINSYIQDRIKILNNVNLRKKLQELASNKSQSKDTQAIKVLSALIESNESKGNKVIHISHFALPRWEKEKLENKEECNKVFDERVLKNIIYRGNSSWEKDK